MRNKVVRAELFVVLWATLALLVQLVVSPAVGADPLVVGSLQAPNSGLPDVDTGSDSSGSENSITNIRLGDHGAETRFVMEIAGSTRAQYQVFTLTDPYRVVIDISGINFHLSDNEGRKSLGVISGYRYGVFGGDTSRVVINTTGPVSISHNFVLEPQGGFGRRVVIDLAPTDRASFNRTAGRPDSDIVARAAQETLASQLPVITPSIPPAEHDHRRVIVIDPGHGGIDPGTHGKSGVVEKNVVLAFGKELAKKLRDTGRYDVYMTRNSDVFIPLRDRVAFARKHKADLFISVHANSISQPDIRGFSIYTLSENASDKEAAALAQSENEADSIAGIDIKGESPEVTGILIDLAQRETKNYSSRFAKSVVDYTGAQTSMLDPTHRFAGFVVLKAPDVPSVLVELGFLTNTRDERQLVSPKWRSNVAASFVHAVDQYFGDRLAEGGNGN